MPVTKPVRSASTYTAMAADRDAIGAHRAGHLRLSRRTIATDDGIVAALVDDNESPLAWLARRRGRNDRALVSAHQLLAGERLRADFTRAHMMPRITSVWDGSTVSDRRGPRETTFSEASLAAQQRVRRALGEVGPEFSGLLLDVCCFLKRLDDVERERGWPSRSAKVVLQLALDRLARHYGLAAQATGKCASAVQTWLADDAGFEVGCV